jgi:electron transfer flavoprotein alpha/beta subunit
MLAVPSRASQHTAKTMETNVRQKVFNLILCASNTYENSTQQAPEVLGFPAKNSLSTPLKSADYKLT